MRTLPPAVHSMLSWRSPPSLSLRMLWLPPLHSVNPNPRLHPASSVLPPSNRPPQSFFNPSWIPVSDSRCVPQSMTLSRCFSGPTSPVPIPSSPESDNSDSQILVVVSFYKFADFPDHASLRQPLKQLCEELVPAFHPHFYIFLNFSGIILAREGINGSICGTRESVEKVLEFIQNDNCLEGLRRLESLVREDAPFRWDHVRVKLKKEIVSLGMPDVSPMEKVGKYVSPRDWNALISDPDTVVIDVRNNYETRIGKFKGAVDPCTKAFREFPSWVDDQFQPSESENGHSEVKLNSPNESINNQLEISKPKTPLKVAMYCTGGIRCEKASSFLLSKGFEEVYHLEGGILKYLEEVPRTESLWEGECFVFDKRVSVEHGLAQGTHKLCYGCKQPVSDADMESPQWEHGVTCPYCFSSKSDEEKDRARARQRQFETWGIIDGQDKGRKPDSTKQSATNLSNSV
ncbi:hypothetical protein ACFX13_042363 [Malus domestica]